MAFSSDICGPVSQPSLQGNKIILTFIDTASRFLIVFFLPNRQNLPAILDRLIKTVKHYRGQPFSIFTSDNAKEYIQRAAKDVFQRYNITPNTTTPYNPQENGIAERINLTLFQSTRAALKHSKLPPEYWEYAMSDAVHTYNITLHRSTKQLPYTLWNGHPPFVTQLFAFGKLAPSPTPQKSSTANPNCIPAPSQPATSILPQAIHTSSSKVLAQVPLTASAQRTLPHTNAYTTPLLHSPTPSNHTALHPSQHGSHQPLPHHLHAHRPQNTPTANNGRKPTTPNLPKSIN